MTRDVVTALGCALPLISPLTDWICAARCRHARRSTMNSLRLTTLIALALVSVGVLFQRAAAKEPASKDAVAQEKWPCDTNLPDPYFMKSWYGQPGIPDHTDSRQVTKGTIFACLAQAASTAPVPACILSFKTDGQYMLKSHEGMNSPLADVVSLTCNGQQPSCCKVQVVPQVTEKMKKRGS